MTKAILFLFLILCQQQIWCQQSVVDMPYNNDTYDVFKIKLDPETVKKFQILENKTRLNHQAFASTVSNDSAFFLINASITDSFCNPIGYFVNNSQQINPANLGNGNGNFYLKPNGALLFTTTEAIICESSQISNFSNVRVGIQSGPMLIHNGIINSQFKPSSPNKHIRCAVGIYSNQNGEKFLAFCISNNPVSFFDFAEFMKNKLKCTSALCLESGNCVMTLPNFETGDGESNTLICNYIYFKAR
jgi:uncharacterized protein YigE (DUF2233 family)